ncbi:hypothetical protein [Pajaroellobacter abortibovis]|uniref:Uncharacterized protein n=1 Tax=Pajaroellobacter abortibovis TaxID=1882918 RepID=A0A1L6MWR6_9BACT|nr:hypothetical protein [Pajaroellobacter abortibovis]APR99999.1 hypothetical protein BCY86_04345 [Pajaroellobacter abortibovis]
MSYKNLSFSLKWIIGKFMKFIFQSQLLLPLVVGIIFAAGCGDDSFSSRLNKRNVDNRIEDLTKKQSSSSNDYNVPNKKRGGSNASSGNNGKQAQDPQLDPHQEMINLKDFFHFFAQLACEKADECLSSEEKKGWGLEQTKGVLKHLKI